MSVTLKLVEVIYGSLVDGQSLDSCSGMCPIHECLYELQNTELWPAERVVKLQKISETVNRMSVFEDRWAESCRCTGCRCRKLSTSVREKLRRGREEILQESRGFFIACGKIVTCFARVEMRQYSLHLHRPCDAE